MKIALSLVFCFLSLVSSTGALANADAVKTLLQSRFPEVKAESITKSAFGGLYEIFAGNEIFYTDEKVTFIVLGNLMDAKTRENVTEARLRKLTAIPFDQLPLDLAFKTVLGKGTRKIAVFGDPYCGYCKRFENDILTLKDVTIYTFLYPVIRAESVTVSKKIWCSADRVKAWQDLMLRSIEPSGDGSCDNPIDKVLAFGQKLRVSGTPTSFFEDGERMSGALPAATIEKKLVSAAAAKK